MDRNSIIGLTLIFILFFVWQWTLSPTPEEIQAQKDLQDSLQRVEQFKIDSIANLTPKEVEEESSATIPDSTTLAQQYGLFANSAVGEEQLSKLENDLFEVTFSSKGGIIREVTLKEYFKVLEDSNRVQSKVPLKLLEDPKNKFEYTLNTKDNRIVKTSDLIFEKVAASNTSITFRANVDENRYLEQKYTIEPGTYKIDYDLKFEGLNQILKQDQKQIELSWVNYLDKLELNTSYERNFSSGYFKETDDSPDYCSCRASDVETIEAPLKWVSGVNQFFNSSLIAENAFSSGVVETVMLDEKEADLKIIKSNLKIPYTQGASETFAMQFYIGPNEFGRLRAMGHDLDQVIPFGSSILGTINRWVIRPAFSLLQKLFSSEGLTILILTLLIKLALYPLTYKMLYSQSKMGALKPHLESLKGKHKDDPQAQQMEQMKLYREFGVNPLGGCMPMVLQMPIWIALYRFFPASIEFRQAGFWWANDLSSYDAFFQLPFTIPFGFGAHLSLFTLLWAATTLVYTYYNTKHMDMSANPAMKYMQYLMPLFFMGFFNSFASGLTCYLFFSNLINITQTLVTKNYIINQDKIKEDLEAYRKKPKKKKKGGFQARMEKLLEEQKRIAADKESEKKSPKKKSNDTNASKPVVDLQGSFDKIIKKLDDQLVSNVGSNGNSDLSAKSSRTIASSISEIDKLVNTDGINPKKMVNRTTARRLRSLLTEIETIVSDQPNNKHLAKIDLSKVKNLKTKI